MFPREPGDPDSYLAKADLENSAFYRGKCRNATIARWNGKEFVHWRYKWGQEFRETIPHPEDYRGYDIFFPLAKISEEEAVNDLCGKAIDLEPRKPKYELLAHAAILQCMMDGCGFVR